MINWSSSEWKIFAHWKTSVRKQKGKPQTSRTNKHGKIFEQYFNQQSKIIRLISTSQTLMCQTLF